MSRRTSKETYAKIITGSLLPHRRAEVYRYLYSQGSSTAGTIERAFIRRGMPQGRHVNKRLSELRRQGVVVEVGEVKCDVTGHVSILWDVTDALPVPFKRNGRKNPKVYVPETCASCPLVASDGAGRDVCWMDMTMEVDPSVRPESCGLNKRDFVIRGK